MSHVISLEEGHITIPEPFDRRQRNFSNYVQFADGDPAIRVLHSPQGNDYTVYPFQITNSSDKDWIVYIANSNKYQGFPVQSRSTTVVTGLKYLSRRDFDHYLHLSYTATLPFTNRTVQFDTLIALEIVDATNPQGLRFSDADSILGDDVHGLLIGVPPVEGNSGEAAGDIYGSSFMLSYQGLGSHQPLGYDPNTQQLAPFTITAAYGGSSPLSEHVRHGIIAWIDDSTLTNTHAALIESSSRRDYASTGNAITMLPSFQGDKVTIRYQSIPHGDHIRYDPQRTVYSVQVKVNTISNNPYVPPTAPVDPSHPDMSTAPETSVTVYKVQQYYVVGQVLEFFVERRSTVTFPSESRVGNINVAVAADSPYEELTADKLGVTATNYTVFGQPISCVVYSTNDKLLLQFIALKHGTGNNSSPSVIGRYQQVGNVLTEPPPADVAHYLVDLLDPDQPNNNNNPSTPVAPSTPSVFRVLPSTLTYDGSIQRSQVITVTQTYNNGPFSVEVAAEDTNGLLRDSANSDAGDEEYRKSITIQNGREAGIYYRNTNPTYAGGTTNLWIVNLATNQRIGPYTLNLTASNIQPPPGAPTITPALGAGSSGYFDNALKTFRSTGSPVVQQRIGLEAFYVGLFIKDLFPDGQIRAKSGDINARIFQTGSALYPFASIPVRNPDYPDYEFNITDIYQAVGQGVVNPGLTYISNVLGQTSFFKTGNNALTSWQSWMNAHLALFDNLQGIATALAGDGKALHKILQLIAQATTIRVSQPQTNTNNNNTFNQQQNSHQNSDTGINALGAWIYTLMPTEVIPSLADSALAVVGGGAQANLSWFSNMVRVMNNAYQPRRLMTNVANSFIVPKRFVTADERQNMVREYTSDIGTGPGGYGIIGGVYNDIPLSYYPPELNLHEINTENSNNVGSLGGGVGDTHPLLQAGNVNPSGFGAPEEAPDLSDLKERNATERQVLHQAGYVSKESTLGSFDFPAYRLTDPTHAPLETYHTLFANSIQRYDAMVEEPIVQEQRKRQLGIKSSIDELNAYTRDKKMKKFIERQKKYKFQERGVKEGFRDIYSSVNDSKVRSLTKQAFFYA